MPHKQAAASLPMMTKAQLRDLQARITALLGSSSGPDVTRFHEAFVSTFPKSERVPPLSLMVARAKRYRLDVEDLEAFVRRRFKPKHPAEHRKAVRIVLHALRDLIAAENRPVTPVVVAQHLGRYREAVESAFPGYCDSGLLASLLKYDAAA